MMPAAPCGTRSDEGRRSDEEKLVSVYIVANITIHDRAEYDVYVSGFMEVFQSYRGEILAVSDAPSVLEGEWPHDRTVLLRFPTREEALRWAQSPEYVAIAKHRHAGATSNVVILDGFEAQG
jgi:uncharacterized protein (DUF1330 family)